ncbi:phosphoribosylanthranilate isomerase [Hymenobacter sp. RP-2-7]|uniref:N-(5'-phosphoribosyl)anthranilate isomerase n=1 Tax=Hymenobacter polaris TaxID=2682546 RepID=A0A7Y0AFI7_9BACT|nr:phosphoribosylanthranilate isomerase [Hymenobacter polaris]NML66428.1 phosphoribosylanthranilate isomerase [Hymenobacter polaris]
MKIKVCGMRQAGNLAAIAGLDPDFLGFIFSPKSARYMGEMLEPCHVKSLPAHIGRIGVFVDDTLASIQAASISFGLDYAQLHGHETPAFCQQVRATGLGVIKAFAVGPGFDFSSVAAYAPVCDYFLFDTKGELPGGNGQAFDWQLLHAYQGPLPFFLGGGLGPANLSEVLAFRHPYLYAFDFNSQLETAPGLKDVARTRDLLTRLHEQAA